MFKKSGPEMKMFFVKTLLIGGVLAMMSVSSAYALKIVSPNTPFGKITSKAGIAVKFDENIAPGTVTDKAVINGSVSGLHTVKISVATTSATLTSEKNFAMGEVLTVTIKSGIQGTSGSVLALPRVFQFFVTSAKKTTPHFFSAQDIGNSDSRGVALGDFNKDGYLDAFLADATANMLWLNDGKGTFSIQPLGNTGNAVAAGDLNRDGHTDVFIADTGEDKVLLNDGTGNFTAQTLGDSDAGKGAALGDLDGDGDLDAFVANAGADTVWINNGAGIFTPRSMGDSDIGNGAALGDLDGDGDLDAFVANSGADKIWLNNGSGTFTEQSLEDSDISNGAAFGDFNGDGYLDVFVANEGADKVLLNDKTGHFAETVLGDSDPGKYIALGDFDGDGDMDAFAANASLTPDRIWLNDGKGVFTKDEQGVGSSSSNSAAVGDLNGDELPDVFVANYGVSKVWLNNTPPEIRDKDGKAIAKEVAVEMDENSKPEAFVLTLTASDSDNLLTARQPLTWSIGKTAQNGSASVGGTGSVSYTPKTDYDGKDSFDVTLSDGADSVSLTVNVTIRIGVPVIFSQNKEIENFISVLMNEDKTDTFSLTLTASNPSKPSSILTWVISSAAAHGTARIPGSNTVNSVSFDYVPNKDYAGRDTFNVQVGNQKGGSVTISVIVDITPENDAPVITGPNFLTAIIERPLEIRLTDLKVVDPDNFYPGEFKMEVTGGENYTLSGNTLTPATGFRGELTVPIKVNDGKLDSAVFNLPVEVVPSGDIDGNQKIDLRDVILVLMILTDIQPGDGVTIHLADVNDDHKIGIQELVFILNFVLNH